ncbi:hypothetical protein GCM10023238_08630 [Streptomyces heliomycini]
MTDDVRDIVLGVVTAGLSAAPEATEQRARRTSRLSPMPTAGLHSLVTRRSPYGRAARVLAPLPA